MQCKHPTITILCLALVISPCYVAWSEDITPEKLPAASQPTVCDRLDALERDGQLKEAMSDTEIADSIAYLKYLEALIKKHAISTVASPENEKNSGEKESTSHMERQSRVEKSSHSGQNPPAVPPRPASGVVRERAVLLPLPQRNNAIPSSFFEQQMPEAGDVELNNRLDEWDRRLQKEQQELQNRPAQSGGRDNGSSSGRSGSGGRRGAPQRREDNNNSDLPEITRQQQGSKQQEKEEQERADGEQKGPPPQPITRDTSGEDEIAQALREAAEKTTDPALKKKLWKEYEEYRKNQP